MAPNKKSAGSKTGMFVGGQVNKNRPYHHVIGIETLDSDLINTLNFPISWRTEIGLDSCATSGEEREERLKGV